LVNVDAKQATDAKKRLDDTIKSKLERRVKPFEALLSTSDFSVDAALNAGREVARLLDARDEIISVIDKLSGQKPAELKKGKKEVEP
jgi:hypothetical protein